MNAQDQPRRPKRSLLLSLLFILALLMSVCCMLLFAQLTLSGEKQEWLEASMATRLEADYRSDNWVETPRFAPLRIEVINETAEEVSRDEQSSPTPLERVESQADSPRPMPVFILPVYEWSSD